MKCKHLNYEIETEFVDNDICRSSSKWSYYVFVNLLDLKTHRKHKRMQNPSHSNSLPSQTGKYSVHVILIELSNTMYNA